MEPYHNHFQYKEALDKDAQSPHHDQSDQITVVQLKSLHQKKSVFMLMRYCHPHILQSVICSAIMIGCLATPSPDIDKIRDSAYKQMGC